MSSSPDSVPLWTPDQASRDAARLTAFLTWLRRERGLELPEYGDLWAWSVADPAGFWDALREFFGVRLATPADTVLGDGAMPGAEWFPGAQLNYAGTCSTSSGPRRPSSRSTRTVRRRSGAARGCAVRSRRSRPPPGAGRTGGRPRCRLPAQRAGGRGGFPGHRQPRRGMGGLRSRVRYRERGGPVRPARAGRPGRQHRLPVRRSPPRPHGRRRGDPRGHPVAARDRARRPRCGGVRRHALERAVSTDAELSITPVPFDHPLWVLFSSAPPGLRRGSCTATAGSCWST